MLTSILFLIVLGNALIIAAGEATAANYAAVAVASVVVALRAVAEFRRIEADVRAQRARR